MDVGLVEWMLDNGMDVGLVEWMLVKWNGCWTNRMDVGLVEWMLD